MDNDWDFTAEEGFGFMGRVNARISHEMKNIMATISETAGLMEDWVDLAATGRPLDMGVLKNCCQTISAQIQRGFTTINEMNRFAHSVDRRMAAVDIHELLGLATGLAGCLRYAKKVSLPPPDGSVPKIRTHVLFLVNLLYSGLDFAFQNAGPEDEIKVVVYDSDKNARIVFSGLENPPPSFPDSRVQSVARLLKAQVLPYGREGELHIIVPLCLEADI